MNVNGEQAEGHEVSVEFQVGQRADKAQGVEIFIKENSDLIQIRLSTQNTEEDLSLLMTQALVLSDLMGEVLSNQLGQLAGSTEQGD